MLTKENYISYAIDSLSHSLGLDYWKIFFTIFGAMYVVGLLSFLSGFYYTSEQKIKFIISVIITIIMSFVNVYFIIQYIAENVLNVIL